MRFFLKLTWIEHSVLNRHPNPICSSLVGYRCCAGGQRILGLPLVERLRHSCHSRRGASGSLAPGLVVFVSRMQMLATANMRSIYPSLRNICLLSLGPAQSLRTAGTGNKDQRQQRRSPISVA